ncbi:MAG TPA: ABC transporter ATP-binding protein [Candidatus Limnocylindrales bacterium]|nr:ABC transporter ATP-binding protein [Candidatus Limnocylindrales bacterium]
MGPGSHNHAKSEVYRLKNVVKKREKGGNLFELRIPELILWEGEFIAIVGESGCGKSTLLDMLGLIMRPTRAEEFTVCIPQTGVEHSIMDLSEGELANIRKSHLGYVLQTGGLLSFLTAKENILLPCSINGMNQVEDHIQTLVMRLKIADQLNKKPQFLSGGQRQRVAIARALAHRPSIVLADEPTAAVDKLTAYEIRDQFKELTRQIGVTLLIVTHDKHLVEGVVDRTFTFDVHKESNEYTYSECREGSSETLRGNK